MAPNALFLQPLCIDLLAQSRVAQMNEAFRAQQSFNLSDLLTLISIILAAMAIAGIIYFVHHRKQRRFFGNNPQLMFRELCSVHSLSWSQRRALKKLSRVRRLTDPGLVFIDSTLWPSKTEAQRLLGTRVRGQLCLLRRHLFTTAKAEYEHEKALPIELSPDRNRGVKR